MQELEPLRIIKSDKLTNNVLPVLFGLAGSMGFDPEHSDVVFTLASMVSLFGIGHVLQFAEAYFRRSMAVRSYVDAVMNGSERVRGEDSLY